MKRLLVYLVAIASVCILAVPALAVRGGPTISAAFNATATTATVTSSKRISSYRVELCSGPAQNVRRGDDDDDDDDGDDEGEERPRQGQLSRDRRTLTVGPFGSPIVSVKVRSRGTVRTFTSGVNCEPGTQVPEAPTALLLPVSILVTLGLAGAFVRHRRRGLTPS